MSLNLKGLILLAKEGINLSIYGNLMFIEKFIEEAQNNEYILLPHTRKRIQNIGNIHPYKKLLIKIKPQIIPFPEETDIQLNKGHFLKPEEFQQLAKEDKVITINARNYYEWAIGSFKDPLKFPIRKFRELAEKLDWFQEHYRNHSDKIFVAFCTGGIRCEKVIPFLVQNGFERIYQIEGRILDYFEKLGNSEESLWEGECFVFDERYSILPNGKKGHTLPSPSCGQPIINNKCVRCGNFQIA